MEGFADIGRADLDSFPRGNPVEDAKRKKAIEKKRKEDKAAKKTVDDVAKKMGPKPKATRGRPPKVKVDADNRQRVIIKRKITQYYAKLSHKISIPKPRALPDDLGKLQDLCLAIETDLAAAGGVDACTAFFINGCQVVERVAPMLPFDIRLGGPVVSFSAAMLANRAAWDDLITEVAIQHSEWFMVSGLKRLLFLAVNVAKQVDDANRGAAVDAPTVPSDDLRESASDL